MRASAGAAPPSGRVLLYHRLAHGVRSAALAVASGGLRRGHGVSCCRARRNICAKGARSSFTADLRRLLEAQRTAADAARRTHNCVVPWVFFRLVASGRRGPKHPKRITRFTKAWTKACVAAGLPGRIPHDLRRSSIRTMVRAGISEHVAMQLAGHRTPSVFRRYDIVSQTDLTDAAAKLDAAAPVQNRDSSVTVAAKRPRRGARLRRIS